MKYSCQLVIVKPYGKPVIIYSGKYKDVEQYYYENIDDLVKYDCYIQQSNFIKQFKSPLKE